MKLDKVVLCAATFCVYKPSEVGMGWTSVLVDGELTIVTDLKEIRELSEASVKKYGLEPKYVE
jgi:hypothetical protein